jgi:hypothetical protein
MQVSVEAKSFFVRRQEGKPESSPPRVFAAPGFVPKNILQAGTLPVAGKGPIRQIKAWQLPPMPQAEAVSVALHLQPHHFKLHRSLVCQMMTNRRCGLRYLI